MLGYIEFLQKFLICISDFVLTLVLLQFTILPRYYTIDYFQCKQQYNCTSKANMRYPTVHPSAMKYFFIVLHSSLGSLLCI